MATEAEIAAATEAMQSEGARVAIDPHRSRSLAYYAGVGVDHFSHDYERIMPLILRAAAAAAIDAVDRVRATSPSQS